jgi:hypothetical protein
MSSICSSVHEHTNHNKIVLKTPSTGSRDAELQKEVFCVVPRKATRSRHLRRWKEEVAKLSVTTREVEVADDRGTTKTSNLFVIILVTAKSKRVPITAPLTGPSEKTTAHLARCHIVSCRRVVLWRGPSLSLAPLMLSPWLGAAAHPCGTHT